MTMDQLTTANAVPLPDTLTADQQARAAAVHQARIALAARGFGTNRVADQFDAADIIAVAGFILDGAVTTLESLDAPEQWNDLADHLLERHGVRVGGPYAHHLPDPVVVDLGDLRTIVEYVSRQTRSTDEPMSAAYARLSATVER